MLKTLKNRKGLFDLSSVMTGVVITGIMAAVTGVAFMVVVPWMYGMAAKDAITTVNMAETSARQDTGEYQSIDWLLEEGYLKDNFVLRGCVSVAGNDYSVFIEDKMDKIHRYDSTSGVITTVPVENMTCDFA